ncbi:MAG TPA: ROK family protein [Jiangellaceae bacterium]|nr:ROK family protein [Jiangellaceae bacterium]
MSTTTPARQALLRERNLATVARSVVDADEPLSRADVAALTGMTRATVSTLVDYLLAAGVVAELPRATPVGRGRPAVPLVPAARSIVGLGLEVNVDYLGGRVMDLTGSIVAELVVREDLHGSEPAATLGRLGRLARHLIDQVEKPGMRVAGARLALPGLVDVRMSTLRVAPNLEWSDIEPLPMMGLPGNLPVGVANEAKLAALAQVWGVPAGVRSSRTFLYVSGDVGVGAAIVVDDEIFHGRHGWSGEIGHLTIDPAGPRCRCGSTGCLERYAGKEALVSAIGLDVDALDEMIVDRLSSSDEAAQAAVHTAGTALGQAIADAVNLLDIDQVLLGGSYAGIAHLLAPAIQKEVADRVLGAPWAPVVVNAAPVADYAALTGGALAVVRGVVDNPARLIEQRR